MLSIKRILLELTFGTDTTLGIVVATCAIAWLDCLQLRPSWETELAIIALALFASHLPDADFLPFLMMFKKEGWQTHWDIWHYPIAFLLLCWLLVGCAVSLLHVAHPYGWLIIYITLAGVFVHFVHDSQQPQGLPWISPFVSWDMHTKPWPWRWLPVSYYEDLKRITILRTRITFVHRVIPKVANLSARAARLQELEGNLSQGAGNEVRRRMEKIGPRHYERWVLAAGLLVFWSCSN